MQEKKISQSLTLWVNAISLIAMLIQSQTGFIVGPEAQAALLTIVNIFLRFKTTKPIKKTGGVFIKSFLIVLIIVTALIVPCITQASEFNPNITGDVIYTSSGKSLQSIGTDLATWQDGAIQLRFAYAMALQDDSIADYTGIGIGLNLIKIIEKAGGNWVAVKLNPSLGVMGLFDLNGNDKPEIGFYMNVLRMDF